MARLRLEVLTSVLSSTTVTRDKERAALCQLIARLLYHVWWRPALSRAA